MIESQVVQQNKIISFNILNIFIFSFPLSASPPVIGE